MGAAMLIYKILTSDQWSDLQDRKETSGAPVDISDGFVHFSTAEQAAETAAKHFSGHTDLWLLAFDSDALDDLLKWEPSRGGQLFPHLYGPMRLADVIWSRPLPLGADGHEFPDDLT